MKIYRIGMFENPTTDRLLAMTSVPFAHFSVLGTWVSLREPCAICGWHWQDYGPPLLVQWEPSTDVIGDFSWDGPFGFTFVVKESVAACLRAMQFECNFLPVDIVPPKRKRKTICVSYPYDGPTLVWGACQSVVDLDKLASEVMLTGSCSACGRISHTFRYQGIVIKRSNWHGAKMFRITTNGNSNATFVTEEGRGLIEAHEFTNIAFSEAGVIVD